MKAMYFPQSLLILAIFRAAMALPVSRSVIQATNSVDLELDKRMVPSSDIPAPPVLSRINLTVGIDTQKPPAATVVKAVDNIAKDVHTVSAAINALPEMSRALDIKSRAQEAADAEEDENQYRAILIAEAGDSGSAANTRLIKYGPTVLEGFRNMAAEGTVDSVKQNIAMIEAVRNPNILRSITELSDAALDASGITTKISQKFPETGRKQGNKIMMP